MLASLEGYAAAILGPLEDAALVTVTSELTSLALTILARSDLRAVLTDTAIAGKLTPGERVITVGQLRVVPNARVSIVKDSDGPSDKTP